MATNSGLTPGGASYPLLTDPPHPDNIKEPVVELDARAPVVATDVAALNSILTSGNRTNRLGFLTSTRTLVAWDGSNWITIGSPPKPSVYASSTASNTITSTTAAALPTPVNAVLDLPQAAKVKIDYSVWNLAVTSGSPQVNLGPVVTGATSAAIDANSSIIATTTSGDRSGSSFRIVDCAAGTNTFHLYAFRTSGSGTQTVNRTQLFAEVIEWL